MIFILGGRGFVGSAFVRYCQAQGLEHRVIDRDSYASLRGQSCDLFVNANGNSKKFLSTKEPLTDFDASVRSVRASLVDFTIGRYVHLSSCDVYPDCSSPETTREEQTLDAAAQSPYGFHKYLAELCVRHAAKDFVICRLGGFVGPGLKKNAIFDVQSGGPLWIDPESALQFMHTDDCARVVMQLVNERGVVNDVVNVCSRGVVKVADVMSWVGRSVKVQPNAPRVRYEVSTDKLARYCEVPATEAAVKRFLTESKSP